MDSQQSNELSENEVHLKSGSVFSIDSRISDTPSISIDGKLFDEETYSPNYSGKSLRKEMNEHDDSSTVYDVDSNVFSDNGSLSENPPNKLGENYFQSLDNSNAENDLVNVGKDPENLLHHRKLTTTKDESDKQLRPDDPTITSSSDKEQVVESSSAKLSNEKKYISSPSLKKVSGDIPNKRPILKPRTKQKSKEELPTKSLIKIDGEYLLWPRCATGFGSFNLIVDLKRKEQTKSSSTDSKSNLPIEENPEAFWGWIVVAASCIIMIPIVGVMSSFGVIIPSIVEEFEASTLETGFIGSFPFGFMVGYCPFSNILITKFGSRLTAGVGLVGATAGTVVTSFIPNIHLMFLTYSFLLGIFANLVFNSILTLAGQYFPNKHQALATCLASAGISFGTLIFNPITHQLMEMVNWRHTFQILGGCIFLVGLFCVPFFRPPSTSASDASSTEKKTQRKSQHFDSILHNKVAPMKQTSKNSIKNSLSKSLSSLEDFKSIFSKDSMNCSLCSNFAFVWWMVATFSWSIGFIFPIIFLVDYMRTLEIDAESAVMVLTAYGTSDFCGRILCALFAVKLSFSMAYLYAVCTFIDGAVTILVPLGENLLAMYGYAIGINSGIINSLSFAATIQFFGNENGEHVWGYVNFMLACGIVVGPGAAGGVYDATRSYDLVFYIIGLTFIFCSGVMALLPAVLQSWPMKSSATSAATNPAVQTSSQNLRPNVRKRRGKKRSLRKKSEESLRRKVLRLSFAKEVLEQQAADRPASGHTEKDTNV